MTDAAPGRKSFSDLWADTLSALGRIEPPKTLLAEEENLNSAAEFWLAVGDELDKTFQPMLAAAWKISGLKAIGDLTLSDIFEDFVAAEFHAVSEELEIQAIQKEERT